MIITYTGYNEYRLAQETNKDKPGKYKIQEYIHRYDKQRIKSLLKEALKTEGFDYSLYYNE